MKNSLPFVLPQLNLPNVEPESLMRCETLQVVNRAEGAVRSNIELHSLVELDGRSTDLCLPHPSRGRNLITILGDIYSGGDREGQRAVPIDDSEISKIVSNCVDQFSTPEHEAKTRLFLAESQSWSRSPGRPGRVERPPDDLIGHMRTVEVTPGDESC